MLFYIWKGDILNRNDIIYDEGKSRKALRMHEIYTLFTFNDILLWLLDIFEHDSGWFSTTFDPIREWQLWCTRSSRGIGNSQSRSWRRVGGCKQTNKK